ncbi:MAG: hypothetical protein QW688_04395 [Thermoprotei archaeon]
MSESSLTGEGAPGGVGGGVVGGGSTRLRRLLMVELLLLLLEFLTGVYMVVAGVGGGVLDAHIGLGVVAGLLGIVVLVLGVRLAAPRVGLECVLGFVFVVVAGVGGLLYLRGDTPTQVYLALMGVGFILSGAFYSMPLAALNRLRGQAAK